MPNTSARLRLFCFPFAGGGASAYRGWARELPAAVKVCPVQYPGRETRITEPLQTALAVLMRMAAGALEPLLDEPYALFGHSMGALAAFELTREIARRGLRPPEQLVVSAYRAPTLPHWSALLYDLPHDEFVERLRKLEGTPQAALESPELMQMMLPVLRAECQVCDQYRLRDETPLAVPLAAFGGRNDPRGWRSGTAALARTGRRRLGTADVRRRPRLHPGRTGRGAGGTVRRAAAALPLTDLRPG